MQSWIKSGIEIPVKAKDLAVPITQVIYRNRNSLLPSVRQVCVGLQQVIDAAMGETHRVEPRHYARGRKWVKKFFGRTRA